MNFLILFCLKCFLKANYSILYRVPRWLWTRLEWAIPLSDFSWRLPVVATVRSVRRSRQWQCTSDGTAADGGAEWTVRFRVALSVWYTLITYQITILLILLLFFLVGDFAYNLEDDNAKVGDEFMRQIEPIAAYVPYLVTPGNHEEA